MTPPNQSQRVTEGTAQSPTYYDGPTHDSGDVHLRFRYLTYRNHLGLVAGINFCVRCTIDRPGKEIWPYFSDFNLWQPDHYYSGVLRDLEGKTFHLSIGQSNDPARNDPAQHQYVMQRVIPEYALVIHQPVLEQRYQALPGLGGVSPGFHVFTLNEHNCKTLITGLMNHESVMAAASKNLVMTDEQALEPWRAAVPEWLRKWRDDFFPLLKKLVQEDR